MHACKRGATGIFALSTECSIAVQRGAGRLAPGRLSSARSTSRWPRSRCFGWEKLAEAGSSDPAKDASILALAHDRTRKNKAPERSEPKGRCDSLFEALERFRSARDRTLQFAESISVEELRAKVVPHPLAGTLDGYQLLTLMAVHPERHALQVEEIKTDPEFPSGQHP